MKNYMEANELLDRAKTFFSQYAPTERGFYVPHKLTKGQAKKIVVQPVELLPTKKLKHLDFIAVLIVNSTRDSVPEITPDEELIQLSESISQGVLNSKTTVNSAVSGAAINFEMTESVKFVPPESHDRCAKAIFTLKLTYS
ncbi:hypothetical protein [Pseudoalteromonas sp. S2755]|uniref:hypothetical protein n=1 Tax=Pseudoalteromonas sp. S2755 TaxID=2066523 RepID=UPI00110B5E91|nr:hypothetical protein [Pseudoalteromonas sp. S2755]TMN34139.1 hypothetical protein CWC03_17260 [Pseudoalteromonas sp. S2755]